MTTSCAGQIIPAAMSLFLKYSHGKNDVNFFFTHSRAHERMFLCSDPGLMSTIEEVFAALAVNPGCHSDLHLRFLPVAMEALQSTENQLPLGLVAVS